MEFETLWEAGKCQELVEQLDKHRRCCAILLPVRAGWYLEDTGICEFTGNIRLDLYIEST